MVLAGTDSNQILPLPLPQRQRVDQPVVGTQARYCGGIKGEEHGRR